MNNLSNTISSLIGFLLVLLILFSWVFLAISIIASLVVPLTWIYAQITETSYDSICDTSDLIYRLNQIGKCTIVIGLGFLLMWIIF